MNHQTLGQRIKELREAVGFSQRALAASIGVSPAAIGRLEADPSYVTSRPMILAIAQFFRCDPDWLETGGGAKSGPKNSPMETRQLEMALREWWFGLTEEGRALLLDGAAIDRHFEETRQLIETALKNRKPLPDPKDELGFVRAIEKWNQESELRRLVIRGGIGTLHFMVIVSALGDRKLKPSKLLFEYQVERVKKERSEERMRAIQAELAEFQKAALIKREK